MKKYLKYYCLILLFLGFSIDSTAQDTIKTTLELGKIEPYEMEITYDKTSHLIFPTISVNALTSGENGTNKPG